ncbi:MAG TPA: DUF1611 domain-containing protein [Planctomycetota bacterium]|nr:DUF1611 domain-containing protein [Planctomycetota bacterium]
MTDTAPPVGSRRMALLCDGYFNPDFGKTATGLLIGCPDEVVAVIDADHAGKTVDAVFGFGRGIPVVATVAEAVKLGARQLVVAVATIGGVLVPGYRPKVLEAMRLGCDVLSGLHEMLSEDAEFAREAAARGVSIHDVRRLPPVPVGMNRARTVSNRRVLAVGSDCASGKMCTALALAREFTRRGRDAKFVATGQTGILIEGDGLAIDRAVCDFASGVAEKLVLDNAHRHWLFIEGQGSLDHPCYSGVTLSLLHGSAPQALVFCHPGDHLARRHDDGSPLLPLGDSIRLHETIAKSVLPAKVVGLSVITAGLDEAAARGELAELEDRHGLPATDPLRFGVDNLADALIHFFEEKH